MKKIYMAPCVEVIEADALEMMALSLQSGPADSSDVLVQEEQIEIDIW